MTTSSRSTLANMILPTKGLYSHRAKPSARGARQRQGLQLAALTVLLTGAKAASLPMALAINAGLFGLFMLAVWILGEGLRAEDDYRARAAARAPRIPAKCLSAVVMGAAIGLTFASRGAGLLESLPLALFGGGLHLLAFGFDPRTDKNELVSAASADRVDTFTAEAEATLTTIRTTLLALRDPELSYATHRFDQSVTALLQGLALYPAGIAGCRKHLTVFLHAIRDTSLRYARVNGSSLDPAKRVAFLDFMAVVEQSYKSQADSVRSRNNDALDLEIGVLRDALQREVPRQQ